MIPTKKSPTNKNIILTDTAPIKYSTDKVSSLII